MEPQSVITRTIRVAQGVFAPGHLGELTQVVDFELVDAVIEETGTRQQRIRLLPTRVMIYFVLAMVLLHGRGYRRVWAALIDQLAPLGLVAVSEGALTRARRRVGPTPVRALFAAVRGPVATADTPGVFWRGLRVVALDGTCQYVPDRLRVTGGLRPLREHDPDAYPLLRMGVLIECGTRAVIDARFAAYPRSEHDLARAVLPALEAGMVLLLDALYDDADLLGEVVATKTAAVVCRSGARRSPLVQRMLPDGSYLAVLGGRLRMRVIEAAVVVRLADGTVRREQWRLVTSLLDHVRWPAAAVVEVYHRRWQVETAYASIKDTMLDGRVLRSQHPDTLEQEVWALLVVYQALVRIMTDAAVGVPGIDPSRFSFTLAIDTARRQLTTAEGIFPGPGPVLSSRIGDAVLADPIPLRGHRVKARNRKHPVSKYAGKDLKGPRKTTKYTVSFEITYFEQGLTARSKR